MLKFLNDNTIEDEDTGITVQVYINPIPLQDYYPYEDIYEKIEDKGREIVAVWLNDDEPNEQARQILKNSLEYYLAFNS